MGGFKLFPDCDTYESVQNPSGTSLLIGFLVPHVQYIWRFAIGHWGIAQGTCETHIGGKFLK